MMMLRPSGGSKWKRIIDPRVLNSAENKEERLAYRVVQGWLGERYVPKDEDEVLVEYILCLILCFMSSVHAFFKASATVLSYFLIMEPLKHSTGQWLSADH
jgi:hypothetical protein